MGWMEWKVSKFNLTLLVGKFVCESNGVEVSVVEELIGLLVLRKWTKNKKFEKNGRY